MLDEIEERLNTPPHEGNTKAVTVDVNTWWKLGWRISGHLNDPPMAQLEAWGKARGFETHSDPIKGTVTFVRKHNAPHELPHPGE